MVLLVGPKSCMHTLFKLMLGSDNARHRYFSKRLHSENSNVSSNRIPLMQPHDMPGRPNAAILLLDPPQVTAHRINSLMTEFSRVVCYTGVLTC